MKGGENCSCDEVWFAKVFVLFRLRAVSGCYEEELAFVKYYKCTQPADEIDGILDCICLHWETEDEKDHSCDNIFNAMLCSRWREIRVDSISIYLRDMKCCS